MGAAANHEGTASATAKAFDVFLSYNGADRPQVKSVAETLKSERFEPWFDEWCVIAGRPWQKQIVDGLSKSACCAVFVGEASLGDWEREELQLALNRAAKDPEFRVFFVLLPGIPDPFEPGHLSPFLSMRTWVDLRRGIADSWSFQCLVNAVKGIPLGPGRDVEPRPGVCPYRGLQVFDVGDADFFYGRDGEVQRLVEKLKGAAFLSVLGPSGSGKSSLVRAGLIPALRRGTLPGAEAWRIEVLTPREHPLDVLSGRLVGLFPDLVAYRVRDELAADARTLRLLSSGGGQTVAWVVDQFEEVFTLCRDEHERGQFILNLLHAATSQGPSKVILTMRADFYPRCAAYPELAQMMARDQFLVGPMDAESLRQAVVEPARRVGLDFEPGLVATILDDVGNEPGALPLLEHALLELWERRRGSLMTLEAYQESGGVGGALAKRAESIWDEFSPDQRQIAQRVLLRLIQPGEGAEDTRRRVEMGDLFSGASEQSEIEAVVGVLTQARLLTTTGGERSGESLVEVSHEALIRGWPRLREWADEDRQGLLIHHRLAEAAQEWEALGRDPGALYRGARLLAAREWADEHEDRLNALE
ncbi:MAG: TIR domain-containing protein, partial [Actinomycetota bacterium]|nr:TIR domain-containing protein [Actinomycetota bacterium]